MKHTSSKKVGKKKHTKLMALELAKIEQVRPARVKRNGKEILLEAQTEHNADKDTIQSSRRSQSSPLSKKGLLKTDYFNRPCVYLLYHNEKIVYIGQTICLAKRISEHMQSEKHFDFFTVHSFIDDEYIRLQKEKILIRKHRPKYNIVHK